MKAYKFVPIKFAQNFASGQIRISPAHTMRYFDGFDDGRADLEELTVIGSIPGGSMSVNSIENPLLRQFVWARDSRGVPQPVDLIIDADEFRIVDNAVIFSASSRLDRELIALMADKFDAGAVFEISDLNLFAHLVSEVAFGKGVPTRVGHVTYQDVVPPGSLGFQPVDPFRKREKFSWQREVRIVWSVEGIDEPLNVQVDEAIKLISRVQ